MDSQSKSGAARTVPWSSRRVSRQMGRLWRFRCGETAGSTCASYPADGGDLRPLTPAVDVRGSASWSPDGQSIATGGTDEEGDGLFKIPVDGGPPVRLVKGRALDPVWSPDGVLIVYAGANVGSRAPLLAVQPDGKPFSLPPIQVQRGGRGRPQPILAGRPRVDLHAGVRPIAQDFWLLDLATKQSRQVSKLSHPAAMWGFDISADGRQIVFDRVRDNSDIALIELAATR